MAQPRSARRLSLDVLRAVAVLLVLGCHLAPYSGTNPGVRILSEAWRRGGWVGVDLFFVLSGFLVSGLLFNEYARFGKISFPRFFVRRAFKIYPPFYLMVLVTAPFYVPSLKHLWPEIFFFQNYRPGVWPHTWSLAVEEHFYVLLPMLLLLLIRAVPREPFRSIPLIFLSLAFVCLAMRSLIAYQFPYDYFTHHFPTHLRLDSLFFGSFLSYLYHCRPALLDRWFRIPAPAALGLAVLLILPPFIFDVMQSPSMVSLGFTSNYLASGLFLLVFLRNERWFLNPAAAVLSKIGSYSYSIYLWHVLMGSWTVRAFHYFLEPVWNWYLFFLAYFFGAIGLGIVMARLVESTSLHFRDRWFPSRAASLKNA